MYLMYALAFAVVVTLLALFMVLRYLEPIYLNTCRIRQTTNSMYWQHIREVNGG